MPVAASRRMQSRRPIRPARNCSRKRATSIMASSRSLLAVTPPVLGAGGSCLRTQQYFPPRSALSNGLAQAGADVGMARPRRAPYNRRADRQWGGKRKMVARVKTVAFQGIEVLEVDVQVQILPGAVGIVVVGLPDKAVGESRERVRGALGAIGLGLPPKRVVVNLAPADVLKEGSHFDLPIALAVLGAMGVLPADELVRFTALGELGLDGTIAPVAGVLPAAIHAVEMERGLICPAAQGGEAAWAGGLEVVAPPNLLALINHFKGTQILAP